MNTEPTTSQIQSLATASQPSTRRDALRTAGKYGLGALAATLIPAIVGGRPWKAHAQDMDAPTGLEILNYALTLEYLERSFYNQGVAKGESFLEGPSFDIYQLIADHERNHVDFLTTAINDNFPDSEGPVSFEDEDFDFTAGGMIDPLGNYEQYLLVSQVLEDTGVRAYKGQAGFLAGSALLTAALQIHSLEARHAAEVRRLRINAGFAQKGLRPWITGTENSAGTLAEKTYAGEGNTVQGGVDLSGKITFMGETVSDDLITQAFDEPLSMEEVEPPNGAAAPFLAV